VTLIEHGGGGGGHYLDDTTQQTQDRSSDLPIHCHGILDNWHSVTPHRICISTGLQHWQMSHVVDR
jgi:hypothetical protein